MSNATFEKLLIRWGEKQNIEQLRELVNRTSIKQLTASLKDKLGRHDCINFWNYLLHAFDLANFEAREKRFACVKTFLDGLLKIELTYKQTYDLTTRLCNDLNTFSNEELIEILEQCMNGIRTGDPKCVTWKDLMPETLNVLAVQPQLNVNGVLMIGSAYRDNVLDNLCMMRWPSAILTPLADMLKELHLSNDEMNTVLQKFTGALQELSPMELPALAYQLFSLCNSAAQIVMPIMALEKYFHRFYYKKLFSDMLSNTTDFDSIDTYSDKELRESEETILNHLNYCTQFKFSETQLLIVFRNFINMPDVILTPFVLSAIISMTTANRDPESARLSAAILLQFLRTVVKHNEDERTLADYSVWCRDTLQRKQVDLEQVFTVLIDQNKEGNDVITPGLVNLAFMLLKAKQSPTLNTLAINFITKFIRKRFIFGRGIVKRIAEWMIVEQDQCQYSECLTMLSVADTFTVSECVPTIKYVLDFFLWLPGEQAMRMMSFILPILKLSTVVRDAFIEVLRKAINASDVRTRRMAVYGFCMILKQLNNSNSRRSQTGGSSSGYCTQQSISGFSLMTQSSFGNQSNPQRNFDMLTLEIIGLLRSCFTQPLNVKITLYENLQRAVELNAKLVPHMLQFIDWHFRAYFDESTADLDDESLALGIRYERLVNANDAQHMEVEIKDNLGCLIQFVAHCLVIFERINAGYDTREMNRILNKAIEQIVAKHMHFEDTSGPTTHLKCALIQQQLNIIEGLIAYALLSSKQTNDIIKHILPLFKQHHKLQEGLKSLANSAKKSQKRAKNPNDDETTIGNLTVNGVIVKKINTDAENIWDLTIVEKLLRLLHEDIVPFAAAEHTNALRSHVELVRYVLEIAANKVQAIRLEPEYKQLAHSKRILKYLSDITKVIFERCIKRLPELWRDFDMVTAANATICFTQCLKTANETYKKRFKDVFVKGFDFYNIYHCKESPYIVQDIIDEFMQEDASAQSNEDALLKDRVAAQIPQMLLQSLQVLYDNIGFENRITTESYTWLLQFCRTYELHNDALGLVHKLLFTQRQKTHSGAFFDGIAHILGQVLGNVTEDDEDEVEATKQLETSLQLKSITTVSAMSCLEHLFAALLKQIEDVDYFIVKANNLNYKCRLSHEDDRVFQRANLDALERAICTQLIHVSKTLLELTKVCIPLGACMDGLMRLLMQHYICLKNLAKHFLICCSASGKISIKSSKFDLLLHVVGKPLPTNIYALIKYIEENILEDNKGKRINPQVEKAKVLRETKLIPKIILAIENFNKHGILLAKKTDNRLANMLHFGTVRDFRIKTADLKAAIERTFSHSSQIEVAISDLAEQETDEPGVEQNEDDTAAAIVASVEAESQALAGSDAENDEAADASSDSNGAVAERQVKKRGGTRTNRRLRSRSIEVDVAQEQETTDEVVTAAPSGKSGKSTNSSPLKTKQLRKNLAKINPKPKKRTLYDVEQNHLNPEVAEEAPAVAATVEPSLKRGRGRTRSAKK